MNNPNEDFRDNDEWTSSEKSEQFYDEADLGHMSDLPVFGQQLPTNQSKQLSSK